MENEIIISQKHKEIISEIIANELSKSLFDLMEMTTKERVKFISEIIIVKCKMKLYHKCKVKMYHPSFYPFKIPAFIFCFSL